MTVETRVKVIKFCSRSGSIDQLLDYLKPGMKEPLRVALWQVKSAPPMRNVMEDLPELAEWMLARWTAGREQRLNDMLETNTAEAPAVSRLAARL